MLNAFLALLLAAVAIVAILLDKAYSSLPVKESKRRVRDGDPAERDMFQATRYGIALGVLLWSVIGLSTAALFVVLAGWLPTTWAVLAVAVFIWTAFEWLPGLPVTNLSVTLARKAAPVLDYILHYIGPILTRIGELVIKFRAPFTHTGLYQKEDLLELLNSQAQQPDNRISSNELAVATGALTYGDKLIRDHMTPKRMMRTVAVDDASGPVLLNDLHATGFSRFPVYDSDKDNFVGLLLLRDVLKVPKSGSVRDVMVKGIDYVHEEESLDHALQAFIKTKHHLFIVVNAFEEVVGLITIEDVLEQIIGHKVVDEFDKYDDLRAVAALHAKKDHKKNHQHDKPEKHDKPE